MSRRNGGRAVLVRLLPGALALACLVAPGLARADELEELELGKNRFEADQYEDAASRFLAMLDASLPVHGY